jgi:AcrR family transcriptional regulator
VDGSGEARVVVVKTARGDRRPNRSGLEAQKRILDVATHLFAENGYHGTGMEAISSAANLGRGALYHHIGSKEELLFEICHAAMSDLLRDSEAVLSRPGTNVERFRALMRVTVRNVADRVPAWKVSVHDLGALTGQRRIIISEARDRWERMVAGVLKEGADAGEFEDLDPIVTKGIIGMFNHTYVWISPSGPLSPEKIADTFSDALLNGLRKSR